MILYIEEEIIFNKNYTSTEIFKEFSVTFKISKYLEEHGSDEDFIVVQPQKITLDEFKMNELVEAYFDNFNFEYGNYGGAGCDFSLTLKSRKD